MENSAIENTAQSLGDTHNKVGELAYSIIPGFKLGAKRLFDAVSGSFFLVTWINDLFSFGWKSLSYFYSSNKNLARTGNTFLEFANFALATLLLFGSALLIGFAQICSLCVMLVLNPLGCFAKALYYGWKLSPTFHFTLKDGIYFTDDLTLKEAEAYFDEFKLNIAGTLISGIVSGCLVPLTLMPVAPPLAASITLATIATAIIVPVTLYGLGMILYDFGKGMLNSIKKMWRKSQGLQGPDHRYDIRRGDNLTNDNLEKNIIYVDTIDQKDGVGDSFLTYRFKDESDNVLRSTLKKNALPNYGMNGAWPRILNEKEIQKLRPHFDSFANSLLYARKEQEQTEQEQTSAVLSRKHETRPEPPPIQPPVRYKPVLRPNSTGIEPGYLHLVTTTEYNTEKQKAYHKKERNNYFAHLSAPSLKSVDELIAEASRQIYVLKEKAPESSLFNFIQYKSCRDKINALEILVRAVSQWNDLYQKKYSQFLDYHSIVLDKNAEICRVLNPHHDSDVTLNRETLIKRIEQCVLGQHSWAYQSFFREQGSVATLFQQGFDLMRRMKTEAEIIKEYDSIKNEINEYEYEMKYKGCRKYFSTDAQNEERQNSIELLNKFLKSDASDKKSVSDLTDNAEIVSSRAGNGARWQLVQRIIALKESEEFFYGKKPAQNSGSAPCQKT